MFYCLRTIKRVSNICMLNLVRSTLVLVMELKMALRIQFSVLNAIKFYAQIKVNV